MFPMFGLQLFNCKIIQLRRLYRAFKGSCKFWHCYSYFDVLSDVGVTVLPRTLQSPLRFVLMTSAVTVV